MLLTCLTVTSNQKTWILVPTNYYFNMSGTHVRTKDKLSFKIWYIAKFQHDELYREEGTSPI